MTRLRTVLDRTRVWLSGYWGGIIMAWRKKP